ncbi:AAA family ATPase [Roseateles aquatilis]|uniref:AAA family ATPase n=1 Tax=Roseateles aquatilis TaxID=431061 RepID=A0A246IW57_9BURK|nr:ATP-binding protein [Roseateles aquatilis]OWQ84404.1 AAA family ATPase [Roseateles aquatilis]
MWNGADTPHAQALRLELDWLSRVLDLRLEQHFRQDGELLERAPPPPEPPPDSELAAWVHDLPLDLHGRLLLALALAPHLRPSALDLLFMRNQNLERGFTEFGGIKAQAHGGFLPTGETAAFLLAGDRLRDRLALLDWFDAPHPLMAGGHLRLDTPPAGEPRLCGALLLSGEALQRLCTGAADKPDYSVNFPAKRITSTLDWDDLVLAPEVLDEVNQIRAWMTDGELLMRDWGLARALKPGYRALFHGPPGTGKTLTATLIGGKERDVYRIDLSMVVSKYIGETEKNLARVFDQAQSRRWVLFFDEADALFGKRGAAQNANDHHANQEIAYLLQRVEDFPGVVILASNLRGNLDEAFSRRFQSMIHFPMPDGDQRLRLWRGMLHERHLGADVELEPLARRYELSGGAIANVIRHAALAARRQGRDAVNQSELRAGIARELRKEGRTL